MTWSVVIHGEDLIVYAWNCDDTEVEDGYTIMQIYVRKEGPGYD